MGGLTRYPVLPIATMRTVPIHNYSGNLNLPDIDGLNYNKNLDKNQDDIIGFFNNTTNPNKSLYYYKLIFKDGIFHINKVQNNTLTRPVNLLDFNLRLNQSYHFITPPEEIARDYLQYPNIKIVFTPDDYSKKYVFGKETKNN